MTKATLTQGQQAAADAFFDFLLTDQTTFGISGSAGVGKTFLMKYLANDIMRKYEASCRMIGTDPDYDSVAFTATTNKAAEVLETALGAPVQTIHSFMGLKVQENYRTGKTTLQETKNYRKRSRLILFIDECSMIDTQLYDKILETFLDCKIVFVGDHAQMAPIGESLSKVYTELDPDNLAVLTEPVRNAGQPVLMALCAQLRDTVETGIFHPIMEAPGVVDYLTDADMQEGLEHIFPDLNPSCRILCYTNDRVQQYNEYIREEVRNLPKEPQPGDVMVVAQAYNSGKLSLSVEREVTIAAVGPVEMNTAFEQIIGEAIPYRNLTIGSPTDPDRGFDIPVAIYPERVSLLVKRLARAKAWGDYFDLKNAFADLRDKASCTVYKAQGSTYDSVFVDLGNIGTSFSPEQVARMLFVAISRAKERVFLYGQLPSRYHNSKGQKLWEPASLSMVSSMPSLSQNQKLSSVG